MLQPLPLSLPADFVQGGEQPLNQLTTLNVLMQTSSESIVQQFTTRAMIINIDEKIAWYFNRCRTCGNKVSEVMPHRHCQQPGMRTAPNYRVTIADDTGSVPLTCFSPEANSLVTTSVTDLLPYIPEPNPYEIPPIIQDLVNTTHIFHLHLAKGSRRGFPRYILDLAEDVPVPALPAAPQLPEPVIENEPVVPAVHGSPQEEQTFSGTAPESQPEEEPPNVEQTLSPVATPGATEIDTSTITPPPNTGEPMEKVTLYQGAESSGACKQLFQEPDTVSEPTHTEVPDPDEATPSTPLAKKPKQE